MVACTKRNDAMTDVKTPMRAPWSDIAPYLTDISNNVLFDDVAPAGLEPARSQPHHCRQPDRSLSEQ
jgi:hypothetical protein